MSRVTGGMVGFQPQGRLEGANSQLEAGGFNHESLLDSIFLNAAKMHFPLLLLFCPMKYQTTLRIRSSKLSNFTQSEMEMGF